ncbi:MAG: alanine racemase [Clostridia bacterium]|nr:alanine racemase [Clostridia bacterium]
MSIVASEYLRRTWAEIDLDALENNYKQIRAHVPSTAKIMSVVKADAYGHGADRVAHILSEAGSDAFAVSNIEEGICLRRSGIEKPILILGITPAAWADRLHDYGLTATVDCYDTAKELSLYAKHPQRVHIKVETGMGRLGMRAHTANEIGAVRAEIKEIMRLSNIVVEGIFTHFATADECPDRLGNEQFERFLEVCEGLDIPLRHCSNSASAVRFPERSLDMVRPGIVLYGLSPDSALNSGLLPSTGIELEPVMSLKSTIVQLKSYKKGDTVSYGGFSLERDCDIAVMAAGYADGYSRLLSNRCKVLLKGKRAGVVGRVCMDMAMIDVTGLGAAKGDELLLFGKDSRNGGVLPIEELAALSESINYELLCIVGRRVPRVYFRNSAEFAHIGLLGT